MELVDLYDENRIPLGRTAERHAPKGENEHRIVVHVCVFDSRGRLLIQKRTAEKRVWPNLWDVTVGGGVDAGETSRQGAEREFREELGYPLDLTGLRDREFPGGVRRFLHREPGFGRERADTPERGGQRRPVGDAGGTAGYGKKR